MKPAFFLQGHIMLAAGRQRGREWAAVAAGRGAPLGLRPRGHSCRWRGGGAGGLLTELLLTELSDGGEGVGQAGIQEAAGLGPEGLGTGHLLRQGSPKRKPLGGGGTEAPAEHCQEGSA